MAELLIAAESIVTAAQPGPALSPALTATPGSPGPVSAVLSPGYVLIEDGWITAVADGEPPRTPDEHLGHGVLVPGLIDLQVNGYYGVEFDAVDEADWRMVAGRLPETGTTAFVPTFITAPLPQLADSLKAAADLIEQLSPASLGPASLGPASPGPASPGPASLGPATSHARILGVHVEGPFITPARKRRAQRGWITDPTPEAVGALLDAAAACWLVMLAPERRGAMAASRGWPGRGVLVSVGHSDATAPAGGRGGRPGARMVTHLFNAPAPAAPPGTRRGRPGADRSPARPAASSPTCATSPGR